MVWKRFVVIALHEITFWECMKFGKGVYLKSNDTVCAARVMCLFGISVVRYNVGEPFMSVQLTAVSAFCVNCTLFCRLLFVASRALIVVKNLGPQFLL